jgi:hypothetical protein
LILITHVNACSHSRWVGRRRLLRR